MPTDPNTTPKTHLYLLLDRSGSMEAIRGDVIGGVNAFLADQRSDGDDALVTLVQFDTVDPCHVVAEAVPIREITDLDGRSFVPRGGTPLLDASGAIIAMAERRATIRATHGLVPEQVLVATVTDGQENSSRRYTRAALAEVVAARRADGWLFAYLSADPEAYADARSFGYDTGSISGFVADATGSTAAFSSLSRASRAKREALRAGALPAPEFFEGVKEAEGDTA